MHPRLLFSAKLRREFAAANIRRQELREPFDRGWPEHQLACVKKIWADVITDIPYYSDLVAAGEAPAAINTWDDFRRIPVLTRQHLQSKPELFFRRSRRPQGFVMTAGSTGVPLCLGADQPYRDLMRVVKLAAWMDFGYTASSRLFLIWGHAHLLGTGFKGRLNHWKRKLADAFLGYERVDAYRLNRAMCHKYAGRLIRHRPLGVIGYASALDLFARYNQGFREQFRGLGVKFVLSTAEPMPNADTQALLEDLFNCPVVQEYGGAEFGQVAFKVGMKDFEVYSDLVYLEALGADDVDDSTLVLTTLNQRYVPLIRYANGDALHNANKLPNGHVYSFESIMGRRNDEILFDDGTSVHSVAIFHCIHQESSVKSIQMVVRDDGFELLLVVNTDEDAGMTSRIRRRLSQVHPLLASAKITHAEDVMTNRAGKRRWFVDLRTKKQAG
jgi:phenylacetate-CoA ligase